MEKEFEDKFVDILDSVSYKIKNYDRMRETLEKVLSENKELLFMLETIEDGGTVVLFNKPERGKPIVFKDHLEVIYTKDRDLSALIQKVKALK